MTDRLGSVRYSGGQAMSYLPYGVEQTSTPNGGVKFGTYLRDGNSSTLGADYADQRYYNPWFGRFNTADPYRGSMNLTNPGSLNRYAYVNGDPVNNNDPSGLCLINGQEYPDPCFQVSSLPGGVSSGGGGGGPEAPNLEAPSDPGFWGSGSSQRVYTGRTDAASNDPANAISPLIVQAMTLVGVNAALAALNNNPDCAGLFENVGFTPDPATVLADIWNGTAYGSFAYGYIPDDVNGAGAITAWTNARTSGNG